MLKDYFVFLTLCNLVACLHGGPIIYVDGWVPIPRERVYDQIRRQWTHNLLYTSVALPKEIIKTVQPRNIEKKTSLTDDKETQIAQDIVKPIVLARIIETHNQETNTENHLRKAKTISDNLLLSENFEKDDFDSNINITADKIKTDYVKLKTKQAQDKYDVTEENTDMVSHENYFEEDVGYQYDLPVQEKQNLTAKFLDILSKYNIYSHDKLTNYDLSRQRKAKTHLIFSKNIPLYLNKYNNLNHLSVDPLLAVFLSNYGFYLPNLYGIHSNYNNLYGYLASNNIHNNKPFGLYKIFSDTDSSN